MTLLANAMLVLAVAATIGLAWSLLPANLPNGPDRGMYGFVCLMFQVPQACFLTVALLLCVARSAPWPAAGGFQYVLILIGQAVLMAGSMLCVWLYLDGFRGGDWPFISRGLVAVPFVIAVFEVLFVLLLMNSTPARTGSFASALTRAGWIVFAVTAVAFVIVGLSCYVHDETRRARAKTEIAALERVAEVNKLTADEVRFRALTLADPLPAWLEFVQYDTPAETKAAAIAGIAQRPTLAEDIRREIATGDYLIEGRALALFRRLPTEVAVGLVDVFRDYGRALVAEEHAAAAEPVFEKARDRFAFADARAIAFIDAGRALIAAGVDVRPELAAVAAAARGLDHQGAQDIVRIYDHTLGEFAATMGTE